VVPYAVGQKKELKRHKVKPHKYIGKAASLTGLTYFARQVENSRLDYLSRYPNRYFRRDLSEKITLLKPMTKDEEGQLKAGKKALRHKEYQSALNIFSSLSEIYPSRGEIWLGLAQTQARLDRQDQAIASLK